MQICEQEVALKYCCHRPVCEHYADDVFTAAMAHKQHDRISNKTFLQYQDTKQTPIISSAKVAPFKDQ